MSVSRPGILLASALLMTSSARGQQPTPPADAVLAAITARGRLLDAYDIAAWHGGDAADALHPGPGTVNASIAERKADGKWAVLYGKLDAARDTFWLSYRADQIDADSGYHATALPQPIPLVGIERAMAAALLTAVRAFGAQHRPYNFYVFAVTPGGKAVAATAGDPPDLRHGYWVYFLPAQTNPRVFPSGGDVRFRITDDTVIAEETRLHRGILDRPTPPRDAVVMAQTSFDTLPKETDVFTVLRRFPKIEEIVVTRRFFFEIHLDGTITWKRNPGPGAGSDSLH
jgi:hypothetical protein